jgi:hypothetical protein
MKLLYFRVGTATASEDDNTTGSNAYPVENFMGACAGTSDAAGTITDDDNAVSVFLKPMMKTQTAEVQNADANPDVIVLACAQYGQKALLKSLIDKVNGGPFDNGLVVLYDGYVDKPAGDAASDIGATGVTIVSQQVAAD